MNRYTSEYVENLKSNDFLLFQTAIKEFCIKGDYTLEELIPVLINQGVAQESHFQVTVGFMFEMDEKLQKIKSELEAQG